MKPDQILPVGAEAPFSRRGHSSGSWFDFRGNVLWLSGDVERRGIALHELTHFFEHCSTPFGLFQQQLHLQQTIVTKEFLKSYAGTIYVPVYDWARSVRRSHSGEHETPLRSAISKYVVPWSRSKFVEQVMDGTPNSVTRQAQAHAAVVALTSAETWPNDALIQSDDPLSAERGAIETDQDSACPMMRWDDSDEIAVGAIHVSEAIAQIFEGLDQCEPAVEDVYLLLPSLVYQSYAGVRDLPASVDSTRLWSTCLTLLDLALFTPIGGIYRTLRPAKSHWRDLHPGHRFLRGLRWVTDNDAWIGDVNEMESLATAISDAFGWPRPQTFLKRAASLDTNHLNRYRDAAAIRLEEFSAFNRPENVLDERSPVRAFFQCYMPMTHHPSTGTICAYPDDEDKIAAPIEQIRDCFFAYFCWNVMANAAGLPASNLPDAVRFDLYFDNVTSESDLIDLVNERHPWTTPDRFRPFHDE